MTPTALLIIAGFAVFTFGLLFGSFANVLIWRIPRGESVSHPPSHCPGCDTPIAWYDNVPLASWLVLRGQCRACGQAISIRYPVVELLSGLLWLLAFIRFGPTIQSGFAIVFFYLLLVLAAIDLDTMRLPNRLVALLGVLGVVGVAVSAVFRVAAVPLVPTLPQVTPLGVVLLALVGAVASAGLAGLIAALYYFVRKVHGFGMGDVKLLLVFGIFLSVYGVLTLFVASVLGALGSVALLGSSEGGMRRKFPFGPFLAVAAVIVTLFGEQMWGWYTGFLQ